jgi:DNA invertase Pin-like site-specific DNA recombinase
MRLSRHTRVSTAGLDPKVAVRRAAGGWGVEAGRVLRRDPGAKNAVERPAMKKLLDYCESGDTVVVWRVCRVS